jgi:hypothetical protein
MPGGSGKADSAPKTRCCWALSVLLPTGLWLLVAPPSLSVVLTLFRVVWLLMISARLRVKGVLLLLLLLLLLLPCGAQGSMASAAMRRPPGAPGGNRSAIRTLTCRCDNNPWQ